MQEAPYRAVAISRRDGSLRGEVLIDEDDFQRLGHYRWYLMRKRYVVVFLPGVGRGHGKGAGQQLLLHRAVMGCVKGDGLVVDHKSGNRLDNRRSNLRVVTQRQNRQNVGGYGKYSKHRGVCFKKERRRWVAYGKPPGKRMMMLGSFQTEDEAAAAAAAFRAEHMPFAVAR